MSLGFPIKSVPLALGDVGFDLGCEIQNIADALVLAGLDSVKEMFAYTNKLDKLDPNSFEGLAWQRLKDVILRETQDDIARTFDLRVADGVKAMFDFINELNELDPYSLKGLAWRMMRIDTLNTLLDLM